MSNQISNTVGSTVGRAICGHPTTLQIRAFSIRRREWFIKLCLPERLLNPAHSPAQCRTAEEIQVTIRTGEAASATPSQNYIEFSIWGFFLFRDAKASGTERLLIWAASTGAAARKMAIDDHSGDSLNAVLLCFLGDIGLIHVEYLHIARRASNALDELYSGSTSWAPSTKHFNLSSVVHDDFSVALN